MNKTISLPFFCFVPLVLLAGCGGGGGSGVVVAPPQPPPPTDWQPGVFLDESTYVAQCATPGNSINVVTCQPSTDVQGTTTDENNFLRSFSNNTYLWYNEITDRDPGLYNDPLAYFDLLKTTATTPSGAFKDKFHFTYDSLEYCQLSQSGVSAGYGAQFALLSASPPREIVVAYTEPNSPATTQANLARGAEILVADGVDVINSNAQTEVDILNAALFPSQAGETHTFTVRDLGGATRDITMTSADVTATYVRNVQTIPTNTGLVGYMLFNSHRAPAETGLIDAVNQLIGVTDLIVDLRYNGGGFLDIASEFAYMIAGNVRTDGRTFEVIRFNDKHPVTNPVTGAPITPVPFHKTTQGFSEPPNQALPTMNLPRVFVITGPNTASASESIINSLRGVDVEVIQIGSTTRGKPYGFYAEGNCGTTYFTIQFKGENEKGFGDYTDGFSPANTAGAVGTVVPGCSVADDFTKPLGDLLEGRLSAALTYRDTQTCPAPSGFAPGVLSKPGAPMNATDGIVPKSLWDSNRIMRR